MNPNATHLGKDQQRVLEKLGPILKERHFYLGGGTAIAIYFAHRHSVVISKHIYCKVKQK